MLIVLGTHFFHHRFLYPPETLNRQPRLIESVWIVHSDVHFQHLAAVDQPPPLDDVKLLAMRRAVIVDEGLGVLTDRIDYQRVAFVMADRLPVKTGTPAGMQLERGV